MKRELTSISIVLMCFCSALLAQAPSIDSLLPPVEGGPTEVEAPRDVKIQDGVVEAATAQDAVNAASEQLDQQIDKKRDSGQTNELGVYEDSAFVKFGSGYGVIAKGVAVYTEQTNPTAGLIAQRNAYVIAYTGAKMAMTRRLNAVAGEGTTEVKLFSDLVANSQDGSVGSRDTTVEEIKEAASGLLKGYIVYEFNEEVDSIDPKVRIVSVTIASTPKTLTAAKRSGAIVDVSDLQTGLKDIMTEVTNGLVPPVGGRVITVGSTGKMAVVGFGSAVIANTANRALAVRSQIDAQRIADARARDALLGLLSGDETMWTSGVGSKVDQEFREAATYAVEAEQDRSSIETIQESLNSFTSSRTNQDIAQSIRKGSLPPGIVRKPWISEDGKWAKSICIYYPDATAMAQSFSKQMAEADLLSGARAPAASGGNASDAGGGSTGPGSSKGRRVDTQVTPLPGGKLNKEDL